MSWQGPWPELCPVKIDEQPPRNFWRPFLTAQIRTQWLHARMLGQKYYLHLLILKLCPYVYTVGLCLPLAFKPVFVAGAPAREPGTGQHRAAPWVQNHSQRRGSGVLSGASMAGPEAETWRSWQVTALCFS